MDAIRSVILKLTGEALPVDAQRHIDSKHAINLAHQIKQLRGSVWFGIVIGGGNFFRGSQQGAQLGLSGDAAHQTGMLATLMNGLILQGLFAQAGLETVILSAFPASNQAAPINEQTIRAAQKKGASIIFAGGLGVPYFTTDTAAVVRALETGAQEVWKVTTVDGIYSDDPKVNPHAAFISSITHANAIEKSLTFMDTTALCLAQQHAISIRVFNGFTENALLRATNESSFGSIVHNQLNQK